MSFFSLGETTALPRAAGGGASLVTLEGTSFGARRVPLPGLRLVDRLLPNSPLGPAQAPSPAPSFFIAIFRAGLQPRSPQSTRFIR